MLDDEPRQGLGWDMRHGLLGIFLILMGIPSLLQAEAVWPRGDGTVRIFNYHLNEFLEVTFRKGNSYDSEGLAAIQKLLRSRDSSAQTPIDPRLLDLVDHLQDRFQTDAVEIISGFRSKELNKSLLDQGRKVSPVSLHTEGKALDIHLDEVREETLRDYLEGLKLGGVGYYGPMDFVHVDVGPVRRWGEGTAGKRKLVGVLQPQAPLRLTSDKNDYLPGETLYFTWEWPENLKTEEITELRLELFRRGQWLPCPAAASGGKAFGLPAEVLRCEGRPETSYGKFRWTFRWKGLPDPLSSNEFYLKRQ